MSNKYNQFNDLIHGCFDNSPILDKKIVRIFLSSTFTDTTDERNYLIEKIYPRLTEYCKLRYGLNFQSVDMRWGIQNNAYENHGTTELCLKEIVNCQNVSLGPNFISLIGQKYGLRPLPTSILKQELEILKNELKGHDLTVSLIEESQVEIKDVIDISYKLDTNSVPSKYYLLPISKIISNFSSSIETNKLWDVTRNKLSDLLRLGADIAFQKGLINQEQRERYFVSITEKEIFKGILKSRIDPNLTALCFVRDIVNLEENLDDSNVHRFIDVKKNGSKIEVDLEAEQLINNLKNLKITSKLNQSNIFHYKVKWKNNGIDPDDLKEYLKSFGEDVFNQVVRLVDQAVIKEQANNYIPYEVYYKFGLISSLNSNKTNEYENDLIQEFKDLIVELSIHANNLKENISKFFGREYLDAKIKEYMKNDNQLPFVITGESGCGKTYLMSYTHKNFHNWFNNSQNYSIITRFLGTTQKSSSIFKTYYTIALQLYYIINSLDESDYQYLYDNLSKSRNVSSLTEFILVALNTIEKIDPKRKILILLDSLDQLTPTDYNDVNKWLITDLPSNVKMIVSTIPGHGNLLSLITKLITKKINTRYKEISADLKDTLIDQQFLHIKQLEKLESEIILENWLKDAKRSLTDEQWIDLKKIFSKAKLLPLFLVLIFDIVTQWHSFEKADEEFLKFSHTDEIIIYLFKQLEKLHGTVIFKRAICYMTVLKNGISDTELEDILSLDDDVLFSVFQYHLPPIRRLPSILWVRIKNDLSKYIVEKEANDTSVIFWYHRRFIEVSLNKYVRSLDKNENEIIFQNIFDFYNETWKDKQKPFVLNEYLKKKIKTNQIEADRFISPQPIEYIGEDGTVRYNKRKLTELPNCLKGITNELSLIKSCELIFYNYEFMHAKFLCDSISDINDDLEKILSQRSSWNIKSKDTLKAFKQLKLFETLMNLCGDLIDNLPDSFAFQITSRLLNYYGKVNYVTDLIDQCDKQSLKHCAFVSPYLQLQPPGGYISSILQKHRQPILEIFLLENSFITVSIDQITVSGVSSDNNNKLVHFFDIKLPTISQFKKDFNMTRKDLNNKVKMRCLIENGKLDSNLPDLYPALFLIIRNCFAYVISANKEIKFFYESSSEILDAYALGAKEILILEKNSTKIKLFFNLDSSHFHVFSFTKDPQNFIKQIASYSMRSTLDLALLLENNEIKQYQFKFVDDPEASTSDSSDDEYFVFFHDDKHIVFNDSPIKASNKKINLNMYETVKIKNVEIRLINLIRPTGLSNVNILKNLECKLNTIDGCIRSKPGRLYLSSSEGDFIIIKSDIFKATCCVFKNFTKQPITEVKNCRTKYNYQKMFTGSLRTNDYIYFVHPTKINGKRCLCKIEIKQKVDSIYALTSNMFVIFRDGVLEFYLTTCWKNSHRNKLLFSVNCNSNKVTDAIVFGEQIFCVTKDGSLNSLKLLKKKANQVLYPSFDRAINKILKLFTSNTQCLTFSENNEINVWDLTNGKIIRKLKIKKHHLTKDIAKLKCDFKRNLVVILSMDGFVTFYKDYKFYSKIQISKSCSKEMIILKETNESQLSIFDIQKLQLFSISLEKDLTKVETISLSHYEIDTNNKLIIVLKELNELILIDTDFIKFQSINYSNSGKFDSNKKTIRFLNYKDEKDFKKLITNNQIVKFKLLNSNKNDMLFGIHFKHDTAILNARLVASNKNEEMEIFKTFICKNYLFRKFSNEIYLCLNQQTTLNRIQLIQLNTNKIIFELNFNSFDSSISKMCIDSNLEYFVYTDVDKLIWLYRIKDRTKLASLPLYGKVLQINFNKNNQYVCLGMEDRRLFCLLVVDCLNTSHQNRIKELQSRQIPEKLNEKDWDEREEYLVDQIDNSSDDYDSDEIYSSNNSMDEEKTKKIDAKLNNELNDCEKKTNEISSDEEIETDQEKKKKEKIFYFKREIVYPLENKINRKDMLNHDWLLNVIGDRQVNKIGEEEEKAEREINDSESIQKELRNEINDILIHKCISTPNMINTNLNVRISNTSSTMCNLM